MAAYLVLDFDQHHQYFTFTRTKLKQHITEDEKKIKLFAPKIDKTPHPSKKKNHGELFAVRNFAITHFANAIIGDTNGWQNCVIVYSGHFKMYVLPPYRV